MALLPIKQRSLMPECSGAKICIIKRDDTLFGNMAGILKSDDQFYKREFDAEFTSG